MTFLSASEATMSHSLFIGLVVIFLFCSVFSFLFSLIETSYILCEIPRLRTYAETNPKKEKRANLVIKLKQKHWVLSMIIFLNNFWGVCISFIATTIGIQYFNIPDAYLILVAVVVAFYVVLFCELLPKRLAFIAPTKFSVFVVYVTNVFAICIYPIAWTLSLPFKKTTESQVYTKKEIKEIAEIAYDNKTLTEKEYLIIKNTFTFHDKLVKDVMIPWERTIKLPENLETEKVLKLFEKTLHNVLPVIDKQQNLKGVLIAENIYYLTNYKQWKLIDNVEPAHFVDKDWSLSHCLERMNIKNRRYAIVVDNFNDKNIVGFITLKDIFKQLIGDYSSVKNRKRMFYEFGQNEWKILRKANALDVFKEMTKLNENEIFFEKLNNKVSFHEWVKSVAPELMFREFVDFQHKNLHIEFFDKDDTEEPYYIVRVTKLFS